MYQVSSRLIEHQKIFLQEHRNNIMLVSPLILDDAFFANMTVSEMVNQWLLISEVVKTTAYKR